jgi:hypothetical protein
MERQEMSQEEIEEIEGILHSDNNDSGWDDEAVTQEEWEEGNKN